MRTTGERSANNQCYKISSSVHDVRCQCFAFFIVLFLFLTSFSGLFTMISSGETTDIDIEGIEEIIDVEDIGDIKRIDDIIDIDLKKRVCCFPAGTKITMNDGSLKDIEDVESGDMVLSYNTRNKRLTGSEVKKLILTVREGVYEINDGLISPTNDHPLYVRKANGRMKWAAVDPKMATKAHKIRDVSPLEVGDELFTSDKDFIEINSIVYKSGFIQTYALDVRSNGNCFADSILAHAKVKCRSTPLSLPKIDGFAPSSRDWDDTGLSVIVSCSDDVGLRAYAYEWSNSPSAPSVYNDGGGRLSGTSDEFTATKSNDDGQWYLHVKIWDRSFYSTTGYSGLYKIDQTDPSASVSINNDDVYTTSTSVTLSCMYSDEASGVSQVRYKNAGGSWTDWEAPNSSKPWTLSNGDGSKTVHYRVKDNAGNRMTVTDTIILDTTPPDIFPSPDSETLDEFNVNPEANVMVTTSDITSGVDLYRYAWSTSSSKPSGNWSDWNDYSGSFELSKSDHGTYYLHVEAEDNAGISSYLYAGPYEINRAPVAQFDISDQNVNISDIVMFNSTSIDDDEIVNYSWDLNNDGVTDFNGADLDYRFNLSYNYAVNLTVTDSDGASNNKIVNLDVCDVRHFYSGKNFYAWRKNNSVSVSKLADILGLENNESIVRFNDSMDVCDWDETYVAGCPSNDFMIYRNDVIRIHLNEFRSVYVDFGTWDSLNVYLNRSLRFVNGGSMNHGYNAVAWTEEKAVRASEIAEAIDLEDFQTVSIYDKNTDTYKTYLKLPGNPTAGHHTLDPWINSGDFFVVKVKNGFDKLYLTTNVDIGGTLGFDVDPEE